MTMEKSDFNRFDCLPNNCVFECSMNNNRGWTPSKTGGSKYFLVWAFKVWIEAKTLYPWKAKAIKIQTYHKIPMLCRPIV